jgi:hypothetical protein
LALNLSKLSAAFNHEPASLRLTSAYATSSYVFDLSCNVVGADVLAPAELVQGKFGRAAGYVDAEKKDIKSDDAVITNAA